MSLRKKTSLPLRRGAHLVAKLAAAESAIASLVAMAASRWADLNRLLLRPGNLVGPGFEPGPEVNFTARFPVHNCFASQLIVP